MDGQESLVPIVLTPRGDQQVASALPLSPAFLARFRLEQELGRGLSGTVYRALDLASGQPRAIKFLSRPDDPELARRFVREGRLMAQVAHPNIVRVYDADEVDGHPYLVTELVAGGTLRQRLDAGPLEVHEAIAIGIDCLDALALCHARGIIHRDVKPANVLLDGRTAKLADFGLARLRASTTALTHAGEIMGTPAYMPPEQADGDRPTPAVDVYALACVLHELIAGKPPFTAATVGALLAKHQLEDPPVLERVSPELASLIVRMLSKKPADRPEAAFARDELARIANPAPTAPVPPPVSQVTPAARGVWPALLALTVVGVGAQLALSLRPAPRPPEPSAPAPVESVREPEAPELTTLRALLAADRARPVELRRWAGDPSVCPLVVPVHDATLTMSPGLTLPGRASTDLRPAPGLSWVMAGGAGAPGTVRVDAPPPPPPVAVAAPAELPRFAEVIRAQRGGLVDMDNARENAALSRAYPDATAPYTRGLAVLITLDGEDLLTKITEFASQASEDPLWTEPAKIARVRTALDAFAEAILLAPDRWAAWHQLGYLLRKGDQPAAARTALLRALALWPSSFWTWRELARTERRLAALARDITDAAQLRREALRDLRLSRALFERRTDVPWLRAEIDSEIAALNAK